MEASDEVFKVAYGKSFKLNFLNEDMKSVWVISFAEGANKGCGLWVMYVILYLVCSLDMSDS